ncbi:MAG: hypothetical protein RL021_394 [Bacteroidota bacterium]|jgi:beta-lactamase class A
MNLTTRKTLLYILVPAVAANMLVWFYLFREKSKDEPAVKQKLACDMKGFRRQGFRFTKPLLMLDRSCDDPSLEPLRLKVLSSIDQMRAKGMAEKISVYFRNVNDGRNFVLNEDAYSPGSMMKLMTMITYLKDAEGDPSLLKRKMVFNTRFTGMPVQVIEGSKGLVAGQSYTINELIEYMITESDNNATAMLNNSIDMKVYNTVLEALALPVPDPHQTDYPLTTESMSRFFRLLYNASFLSPEMSDKALELLTRSSYHNGLIRYLPDDIIVAHKFGEKNNDGLFQLHEGGIIFNGTNDYILIVMTKGKDQSQLADVLAEISRLVFEELHPAYGTSASSGGALTLRSSRTLGTVSKY